MIGFTDDEIAYYWKLEQLKNYDHIPCEPVKAITQICGIEI